MTVVNIPGCTCDREDVLWVGEEGEMPLCPLHEKWMRPLSWESLACLVRDYEAELRERTADRDRLSGAMTALLLAIGEAPMHEHHRRRSYDLFFPYGSIKPAITEAELALTADARRRADDTVKPFDEADAMCPNCQTPWKCNGPHLNDQTPYALHQTRGDA